MPPGFRLRPLRDNDIARLCALEHRAAQTFGDHGLMSIAAEPVSLPAEFRARFAEAELVVVVDDEDGPAGFIATLETGGWLWVAELSVDPEHGRKGLATALLDHALAESRRRGLAGLALSTFRDVPFNAPFYRRRGFTNIDPGAAHEALAARWLAEIPPGIEPRERVLMTWSRERHHET